MDEFLGVEKGTEGGWMGGMGGNGGKDGSRMGGKEGWLDDGSDSLTWRGEEPHKSPVASAECHTAAPDSETSIFIFVKIFKFKIYVHK